MPEHLNKKPGVPVVRVGHRGVGKMEPENTLHSYRRAIRFGVDMVEVDLRQSSDGALVLAHDGEIRDRDGGRVLQVSDHSLAALRELDLGEGEHIPTLEEAIEVCRDSCSLMIDLKGEGFEEDLVRILRRTRFDRVIVPGGSRLSRDRIHALDPTIPISLSLDGEEQLTGELFDTLDTDAVTWHYSLLTAERVERLHRKGKLVFAWTVDRWEEMERLVSIGVDGIISNRPDLLMRL